MYETRIEPITATNEKISIWSFSTDRPYRKTPPNSMDSDIRSAVESRSAPLLLAELVFLAIVPSKRSSPEAKRNNIPPAISRSVAIRKAAGITINIPIMVTIHGLIPIRISNRMIGSVMRTNRSLSVVL